MRIAAAALVLSAAFASSASAQSDRLSDVDYLQAARCRGLAASEALGAMDTASIDAMLKAQGRIRSGYIVDRAQAEAEKAERMADHANTERKSGLLAERAGTCQRFLG